MTETNVDMMTSVDTMTTTTTTTTTTTGLSASDLEELDSNDIDDIEDIQYKRVIVTVQYSEESGLRPFYLTMAKKINIDDIEDIQVGLNQDDEETIMMMTSQTKMSMGMLPSTIMNVSDGSPGELDPSNYVQSEEPLRHISPPLTFQKYLTMQYKRVIVTVQYSEESGLRPFYLTMAKKIKETFPDVFIEKRLLPALDSKSESINDERAFAVLVDGKSVVGKSKNKKQGVQMTKTSSQDSQNVRPDRAAGRSVFVSMAELDLAIAKARKRRRPSTAYNLKDNKNALTEVTTAAMRLEMLRRMKREASGDHDYVD
eukprot:CAMPEP_0198304172 /NCGR_PEP_ID=MMETSP1449-20131203/57266_1 /TAXON_ID=420275 /ORGANISM="Attheya septentrionalis, Strain CCMP2084" /LENGTH=313 /DNA_ID=CAMNT_0044006687 /DNA_START=284 /DNA_END=1225 /DNA_ORIENTATION=+